MSFPCLYKVEIDVLLNYNRKYKNPNGNTMKDNSQPVFSAKST